MGSKEPKTTIDYHNTMIFVGSCHKALYRKDRSPTEMMVLVAEGRVWRDGRDQNRPKRGQALCYDILWP